MSFKRENKHSDEAFVNETTLKLNKSTSEEWKSPSRKETVSQQLCAATLIALFSVCNDYARANVGQHKRCILSRGFWIQCKTGDKLKHQNRCLVQLFGVITLMDLKFCLKISTNFCSTVFTRKPYHIYLGTENRTTQHDVVVLKFRFRTVILYRFISWRCDGTTSTRWGLVTSIQREQPVWRPHRTAVTQTTSVGQRTFHANFLDAT